MATRVPGGEVTCGILPRQPFPRLSAVLVAGGLLACLGLGAVGTSAAPIPDSAAARLRPVVDIGPREFLDGEQDTAYRRAHPIQPDLLEFLPGEEPLSTPAPTRASAGDRLLEFFPGEEVEGPHLTDSDAALLLALRRAVTLAATTV